MLTIDIDTARRFILGKQGLWPGRRWQGSQGTAQAMHGMEYLQLDPLQIIARSHDITLHSRVLDYTPGLWEEAAYTQRAFFDWGGWLATRPMAELPYWRVIMQRERDGDPDCDPRIRKMGLEHAEAIAEMRTLLQERGILSNRDFEMASRTRTQSYRGRKDSALALYYLWRTGEVITIIVRTSSACMPWHRQWRRIISCAKAATRPQTASWCKRRSASLACRGCSVRRTRIFGECPSAGRSR